MKRLLAAVLAAVSLSAFAAWERIGTLQVADVAAQGEAVGKIGSFIGNPFVTFGMAAAISEMPTIKFFGPARPKASVLVPLYLDGDALAAKPAEALESLEFAFLYPVSVSKEAFVKMHPGTVPTKSGDALVVKGGLFGDEDDKTYVVFSADGKWVGASDKLDQAKLALKEVAAAEKSLDGNVVRLSVNRKAFSAIVPALKAAAKDAPGLTADQLAVIESLRSFAIGLRVTDLGIDIRGSVRFADGSEGALCGLKPLGANPLAFAGKSVVSASAQAENSGNSTQNGVEMWDSLVALLKKYGVDVGRFFAVEKKPDSFAMTFDGAALVRYFQDEAEMEKLVSGFDGEKFSKDFQKLVTTAQRKFEAKAPAYSRSFAIKGFTSEWTASERFAATLPEAAKREPFSVGFFSVSSIVKAVILSSIKALPEDQRALIKPAVEQFAAESKRGVASMCWTQKDQQAAKRFFLRISSDEIRAVGGFVTAAMQMQAALSHSVPDDADDGDDED